MSNNNRVIRNLNLRPRIRQELRINRLSCPPRARTSEEPRSTTVNHGEVTVFGQVSATCADVWPPVGAPKAGVEIGQRRHFQLLASDTNETGRRGTPRYAQASDHAIRTYGPLVPGPGRQKVRSLPDPERLRRLRTSR